MSTIRNLTEEMARKLARKEVNMKKISLFLAEGFEEVEALTVVDLARRAGIEVTMVSITGKKEVEGARKIRVLADALYEEADLDAADMLVLPGGMPGYKNLEAFQPLMERAEKAVEQGIYVAAVCGAPTTLGKRGFYQGKKACCYPGMEGELTGAVVSYDKVCVDGKRITSRGAGTTMDFALTIIGELTSRENAEKIAQSVVYSWK